MRSHIILDSGPLGLLFQRAGVAPAEKCRAWAKKHLMAGTRLIVPEIIHYEIRRTLKPKSRLSGSSLICSRSGCLVDNLDLMIREAIEVVNKTVDLTIGGIDLALKRFLIRRGLSSGQRLVKRKHLIHKRHKAVMGGFIRLLCNFARANWNCFELRRPDTKISTL